MYLLPSMKYARNLSVDSGKLKLPDAIM